MSGDKEALNRGHAVSIGQGGDAKGSGAGAGASGGPEDYDADSAGGDGQPFLPTTPKPDDEKTAHN